MATYKLFPIQDSTIYSFYPTMNTGIDPILEVGNLNLNINPLPQVFRFLLKFDQDEINNVITNKVGVKPFVTYLKSFIAEAQGILFDTNLEIYPISGSWNNGNGTYLDSPFTTNGVNWVTKDYEDGTPWPTSDFNPYVTASFSSSFISGGGVWFTGSDDPINSNLLVTQSFTLRGDKDLNVNVSNIVNVWTSSSLGYGSYTDVGNEGFIIKFEDAVEFNMVDAVQPILQFYSVDTNTIYPPVLEFKWDDSFYSSSLPSITDEEVYISLDNNIGRFYEESFHRFRLNVRPKYPVRTFMTSSVFTQNHKLPQESYYALKDLDTNEYVVDFDENYTKISCDDKGNYFDLWMNGLQPERNYKILIQTKINGRVIIEDNYYNFKVING
jgi:hypothetical protein